METNRETWDAEEAKKEALAYLDSPLLELYSSRRLKNDYEDLKKSAADGLSLLREGYGAELIGSLIESESERLQILLSKRG